MVTTDRLYLGKTEIEKACPSRLQEETRRLRGELRRVVEEGPEIIEEIEYLLVESETR